MTGSSTITVPNASPVEGSHSPLLELRDCEPWCVDGDGHPNAMAGGDRYCHSEDRTVPLSLGKPYLTDEGHWFMDHTTVSLRREEDERFTRTILHHCGDDHDHTLELTADEARQLGAALLQAAEAAQG